MTQFSGAWKKDAIGDGGPSSYSRELVTSMHQVLNNARPETDGVIYWTSSQVFPFTGFVNACDGLLEPTNPSGGIVRIASGIGVAQGWIYWNDANIDTDINAAPGNANATDIIALEADVVAQTVRIARIGGAASSKAVLTQSSTIWQTPLAEVVLDGSGNFSSLVDVRQVVPCYGHKVLIERTTLAAAGTTISISNIPNLFKHLELRIRFRQNDAAGGTLFRMRFNGDTGSNYGSISNEFGLSGTADRTTNGDTGIVIVDGFNDDEWFNGDFTLFRYNKPEYKILRGKGAAITNAATPVFKLYDIAGNWSGTAAVNQIDLVAAGTNLDAGTELEVYGII